MLKKLLFILAFLTIHISYAQYDGIRFKMLENGAMHKLDINGIYFTRDGKVWFGSGKGLASFNGNDFTVYPINTGNKDTLASDRIFAFTEDQQGKIWIITNGNLLLQFDPYSGKYRHISFLKQQRLGKDVWIGKLYTDADNNIWMGSSRGFYIYNIKNQSYQHYNLYENDTASWTDKYKNSVSGFAEDAADKTIMWIASADGFFSFNKTTHLLTRNFRAARPADSLVSDGYISQIDVWGQSIWYGTWGRGIGQYDIKSGTYKMYLNNRLPIQPRSPGHIISGLARKSDHEYFVGLVDSMPAVFDTITHKYSYINDPQLQRTINRTGALKKDLQGNTWCIKGGRLFFSSPYFNLFTKLNVPLASGHINAGHTLRKMIWDDKHKLYYAGFDQGHGIFVYDSSLNYMRSITMPPVKNYPLISVVWNLVMDRTGRLWATNDALYVFDSVVNTMVPARQKYVEVKAFESNIQAVETDTNGNLVMLSENGGLIFLNTQNFSYKVVQLPALPHEPLGEFHAGNILIDVKRKYVYACDGKAIYQYRIKDNSFRIIENNPLAKNSLPRGNMSTYSLDFDGNLWVGTRGIYIYEPENLTIIKKLTEDDGLTDNVNINLLQGPPGYMFFFTPRGGNIYSLTDSTFIHFDISNGLPSDFLPGYSYAHNHLFISSGAGHTNSRFTIVSALLSSREPVQPIISSIRVNNANVVADTVAPYINNMHLKYNENNITFSLSGLEYAFPERVEYAFKLDGLDNDWTTTDYMNRTVSYTNLQPGNYRFRVKAKMLGGAWLENKPLLISIVPAFWQTNWFYLLMLLCVTLIIYLAVRQRIRSIRKKERLRTGYEVELVELEARALRAQMNPHFIFNCLNSIKALIQKNDHESAVKYLTTFAKLIRVVFDNSDKRDITLFEEIETCRMYTQLESMRFTNKFKYEFEIDKNIDLKSVMIPALIIQPFIENAIWHGLMPKNDPGLLSVKLKCGGEKIECIIDDNGIGRKTSEQNRYNDQPSPHLSKGVGLSRARLELDSLLNERKAEIRIVDKIDSQYQPAGTTVVLSFG